MTALPRQASFQGSSFEKPVATGLLRRFAEQPEHVYLSLFRCANDGATLRFVLDSLHDEFYGQKVRLFTPLSPLPHLTMGLLADHWQLAAPMHSLFHPPYMLELLDTHLAVTARFVSFVLPTSSATSTLSQVAGVLEDESAFENIRIVDASEADWLLLRHLTPQVWWPPVTASEVGHLQAYLSFSKTYAKVLKRAGKSLGLLLLEADEGARLRASQGARTLLGSLLYHWPRQSKSGRLLHLVVHPEVRGQGLGSLLLQHALQIAWQEGWQELVTSPLESSSLAARWLSRLRAQARQHHQLFYFDL